MKIDLKSALCGLAVGVLVMFAVGAAGLPGETGKYRLQVTERYAMIIDTLTGRVWGAAFNNTADYRNDGKAFFESKEK